MFPNVKHFLGSTFALATLAVSAAAATLPLKPGDYVRAGFACAGAPLAARLSYDGRSFTGAHTSNCSTTVRSIQGSRYVLQSTCGAAGDGSPTLSYTEAQTVTVRTSSRITFTHRTGAGTLDRADYRWCEKTASQQ